MFRYLYMKILYVFFFERFGFNWCKLFFCLKVVYSTMFCRDISWLLGFVAAAMVSVCFLNRPVCICK